MIVFVSWALPTAEVTILAVTDRFKDEPRRIQYYTFTWSCIV